MYNLTQDLSQLTTIPVLQFQHIFDTVPALICHHVQEDIELQNSISEIDLEIGTLYIKSDEEQIKYKFVPSSKFDDAVKQTVKTGESPLVVKVENILKDRICNTYKDLFR